jgi:GWxTD domain-containing protein
MILLLFMQVEWQSINRPYSNVEQELVIYYTIPSTQFKFVTRDSISIAQYEVQLIVYDGKGNQLVGDYWERTFVQDETEEERDSVKLIIPKSSDHYNLKLVDRNAWIMAHINENVIPIKYIGNIQWDVFDDTLMIRFSVINEQGDIDSLCAFLKELIACTKVKKGVYNDSLRFLVLPLPNDDYKMKVELYRNTIRIDEINIPVKISRPFYLDESTWSLKVDQLEYIATPSELKALRNASLETRDSLWFHFWKQHDPTPNTDYNEKEIEYFERIAYCEEHFSHGDKGWRSDRAKVYVRFGQPDEIIRRPYELYAPPAEYGDPHVTFYDSYEIWHYYQMNQQFIFGDRYGLGQYVLLNPGGIDL